MRMKTHLSYIPKRLPVSPKRPPKPNMGPVKRRVLTARGGPWDALKILFAHEAGVVQSVVFEVNGQRGRYAARTACDVAVWESIP